MGRKKRNGKVKENGKEKHEWKQNEKKESEGMKKWKGKGLKGKKWFVVIKWNKEKVNGIWKLKGEKEARIN